MYNAEKRTSRAHLVGGILIGILIGFVLTSLALILDHLKIIH